MPQDKFNELLSHIPERTKPLIVFLYFCGLRLGEALQIEWSPVSLEEELIRLEEEQTKNSEPRTVPLPDALIEMLEAVDDKTGTVFDGTNLRKTWHKASAAAGLGTMTQVEGKPDKQYTGLIVHDLRRSAIKNLMKAGTSERVAMAISGHKTRAVFDRYHIIDSEDVVEALRGVQNGRVSQGESSVKTLRPVRRRKLLTA